MNPRAMDRPTTNWDSERNMDFNRQIHVNAFYIVSIFTMVLQSYGTTYSCSRISMNAQMAGFKAYSVKCPTCPDVSVDRRL